MHRQHSIRKEDTKNSPLRFAFLKTRCCFVEDGKEMYQDSKRTCSAIVLLIKPFVWWRSRCRRRRGLLKLPNASAATSAAVYRRRAVFLLRQIILEEETLETRSSSRRSGQRSNKSSSKLSSHTNCGTPLSQVKRTDSYVFTN